MKKSVAWIAAAALFGAALAAGPQTRPAGSSQSPATRPSSSDPFDLPTVSDTSPAPDAPPAVNDVQVEQALFGSGTHLADVTERVVELLRSEPQGFTARADWLRVDPAPGKTKSLLIRYRFHDKERYFVITGQNRASYAELTRDDAAK